MFEKLNQKKDDSIEQIPEGAISKEDLKSFELEYLLRIDSSGTSGERQQKMDEINGAVNRMLADLEKSGYVSKKAITDIILKLEDLTKRLSSHALVDERAEGVKSLFKKVGGELPEGD